MSEDSLSLTNGFSKTRPVLGDLTNRPAKRGFSVLSGDSGLKFGDGYNENFGGGNGDSHYAKQPRSGVEKFLREKSVSGTSSGIDGCEKGMSVLKDKQPCRSLSTSTETNTSQENTKSLVSNVRREFKSNLLDDCIQQSGVGEGGDASRDSSFSSVPMDMWSDLWDKACRHRAEEERRRASIASATQSKLVVEGPSVTICKDGEGLGVGKLVSTRPGSIEWSRLLKQSSQSHELGRCATLNGGGGCASADVGDDILKACSCSFCLKAAYIWSDLQYQDIKGRISALKKSQKEASILAQKNCRAKETNVRGQGNHLKSSKLESDLTGHWKSLFCHMEDVLVNESNQLQASFLMLKDLRENCKTDLETINGMPSEKQ